MILLLGVLIANSGEKHSAHRRLGRVRGVDDSELVSEIGG